MYTEGMSCVSVCVSLCVCVCVNVGEHSHTTFPFVIVYCVYMCGSDLYMHTRRERERECVHVVLVSACCNKHPLGLPFVT